jgi:hypothetical protein
MSSEAIAAIIQMLERLPESTQERVVEHLREYIEDIAEELRWDEVFRRTQGQLAAAAQLARKEIAEGKDLPLRLEDL